MTTEEEKNSFKALADLQESQIPHPSPQLEKNIMGTARNVSFIGNVIELYFSKALSMISVLFGGSEVAEKKGNAGEADDSLDNIPIGKPK